MQVVGAGAGLSHFLADTGGHKFQKEGFFQVDDIRPGDSFFDNSGLCAGKLVSFRTNQAVKDRNVCVFQYKIRLRSALFTVLPGQNAHIFSRCTKILDRSSGRGCESVSFGVVAIGYKKNFHNQ